LSDPIFAAAKGAAEFAIRAPGRYLLAGRIKQAGSADL
jgi:hypothetical protein